VQDHLFGEKKRSTKDRPVPYTMFTKPELGRIGLNEKQARKQGRQYKIVSMRAKNIARAAETNRTEGLLKVLIDPANDRLLGAACLAEESGELCRCCR
jgi:pyruvate/2-oxoglutarate dehydrogenase complex dihydrolipoamide dehydrogenase (E3) component